MAHVLGSRKRSFGGAVVIALVMAMLIGACGSSGSSKTKGSNGPVTTGGVSGQKADAGKPVAGGSVTFALPAESTGGWCLPEAQLAASGIQVARAIYDYLAVPDNKGGYVPDLADKITPNADFTSWTIHLRSGITFHDGTPFDAQDVKDNLDAYRGQFVDASGQKIRKPQLFIFVFDHIKTVSVVDPATVRVDMTSPWASFPASLYSYGRLGMMAEKQLHDGTNCFEDMIGTGPFMFKNDWVRNDHLTVVKNPHYWRKDADGQALPYLDKLVFKPVIETSTLVNGLQASPAQFDLALTDDTVAISQLEPLVGQGALDLLKAPNNPEVAYTMFNDAKPPFNNILARKAFASAINRDEYNRIANKGLLQLASGPFGPGTMGYVADTGLPKYDLAAAKDYVRQYTAETHQPLSFTFNTTSDPIALTDAQLIQKYAQAAGMKMAIKQVTEDVLINYAIYGTFQASAWRNHPGFDPDTQWVWWHCSVAPADIPGTTHAGTDDATHVTGNNCENLVDFSKFNDAIINKAFETARATTDVATRTKAYEDINKEFAKQVWEGWGYWSLWTIPSQKNVEGLLGPNLPSATSPDASASGASPYSSLSSGIDPSGLWLKK